MFQADSWQQNLSEELWLNFIDCEKNTVNVPITPCTAGAVEIEMRLFLLK